MPAQPDYAKIAPILGGSNPMDYAVKPDGSMVIIASTGQKFTFTADQVLAAQTKPRSSAGTSPRAAGRRSKTSKTVPVDAVPQAAPELEFDATNKRIDPRDE